MQFVKAPIIAKRFDVSESYIRDLRQKGIWKENIHWVYVSEGSNKIRYNLEVCLNWFACRGKPEEHEAFIERFIKAKKNGGLAEFSSPAKTA